MEQDIRFCRSADGVRIAYAVTGSGPPLVRSLGWFTHLEYEWDTPYWRHINEQLGRAFTLIRYDGRGMGLSDRKVTDFSLDAKVGDLEAVVDAVGLERCVMFGISEGGPTAAAYTARHPERVTHLILYGTAPSMERARPPEGTGIPLDMILTMIRQGWGSDVPSARQFFTGLFMPDASGDAVRLFTEYQRRSAPAENVAAMMSALLRYDVTDLAPRIACPTLVLHRRGDTAVPFDGGRQFAALIPGARFVTLDGRNHVLMPEEPATAQAARLIVEFAGGGQRRQEEPATSREPAASGLVTILFTDMEGSTALTQRLGDARAQDVLRAHNAVIRDALKQHGGTEIKHTGDGIMASFGSAARALQCAVTIQQAFASDTSSLARGAGQGAEVRVRIGLNAGEPVAEDGDLFGVTVQLAARVCSRAAPEQILASNVVRELAMGKGFRFEDLGEFVPRGFEEPIRVYEVRWAA